MGRSKRVRLILSLKDSKVMESDVVVLLKVEVGGAKVLGQPWLKRLP